MTEYNGVKFTVMGTPVAKGRPKFARRGNFVATYTPTKTVNFESIVKLSFMQSVGTDFTPYDEALCIRVNAFFTRPKGHFGSGKNAGELKKSAPKHMLTKPDADNVLKACIDALNGVAFTDDKLIVHVHASKAYSERPRCDVEICTVD